MKRISVPNSLDWTTLAKWSIALSSDRLARDLLLDMSTVQHAPPHGMLLAASCIRRLKRRHLATDYSENPLLARLTLPDRIGIAQPPVRHEINRNNTYLAHMGFWQAIGEDYGKQPGEAAGSERYLPITMLSCQQLRQEAWSRSVEVGDVIVNRAERLAEILAQGAHACVETTLQYAIRELLRNIIEHSRSTQLWYSAQFWPTKDLVEVAVLDEGIGVLEALTNNPENRVSTEASAIALATERGVTGTRPKPALRTIGGESCESRYENSGWGLFVLRRLAEAAGSLLIVSNNAGIRFTGGLREYRECAIGGVCVSLRLKPSRIDSLLSRILDESTKNDPPSRLTPSMLARIQTSYL